MTRTFFTTFSRTPAVVEYEFVPEIPEVRYFRDGSGQPGEPEEYNLLSVRLGDADGVEIMNSLSSEDIECLEEEARCHQQSRNLEAALSRAGLE